MISQELAKAKSYYLDTETFNEKEFCVKVTFENVAKVYYKGRGAELIK